MNFIRTFVDIFLCVIVPVNSKAGMYSFDIMESNWTIVRLF